MAEDVLVVDRLKMTYEGFMNLSELHLLVTEWFSQQGYDWAEVMNQEINRSTGRDIVWIFRPDKTLSNDYYKAIIVLRFHGVDINDATVNHEGRTVTVDYGHLKIVVSAYLRLNTWGKVSGDMHTWVLAWLRDNFFGKKVTEEQKEFVAKQVDDIMYRMKSYLNMFKEY